VVEKWKYTKTSFVGAERGFYIKIALAPSYFPVGQPPEYLRRSNVSQTEFGMESVWFHRANGTRMVGLTLKTA
jgi:hypothetical protein